MKTIKVRNIAPGNTQVTIHGNSGKTWHLPPGYSTEIPENEMTGNRMVEMLKKKQSLLFPDKRESEKKKTAKSAGTPKGKTSRSGRSRTRSRTKTAPRKTQKK